MRDRAPKRKGSSLRFPVEGSAACGKGKYHLFSGHVNGQHFFQEARSRGDNFDFVEKPTRILRKRY
jgi:hypothetical protein